MTRMKLIFASNELGFRKRPFVASYGNGALVGIKVGTPIIGKF
jgi:hypothetical protein